MIENRKIQNNSQRNKNVVNIKIDVNKQSPTFGAYLNELIRVTKLLNLVPLHQKIVLDISECKFSNPSLIGGLIILKEGFSAKGYNISFSSEFANRGFESYLNAIQFPKCVNPFLLNEEDYSIFLEKYKQRNYIPVTIYCRTEIEELNGKREKFISAINGMLFKRCNLKGEILSAVRYLISEALDNVLEHSKAEFGLIFIQYYPKMGHIDLIIGDCGIGLLGSYQTRNDRYPNILTHSDAMQRAINGESTKNIPESRGFGISTSRKMLVEGLKGTYFLMSGSAFYVENERGKNIISLQDFDWSGTILTLRIPFTNFNNFSFYNYVE